MYVLSRLSRPLQWGLAIVLLLPFLSIAVLLFVVPPGWHLVPVLVVIPFILAPLESLCLTPLYVLLGRFRYYSPMLLATRSEGSYDLHVGTLFDYVARLRWADRGVRARRIVSADLLKGLLALAEQIEQGELAPSTPVTATSYFFSERSIARLGFVVEPARQEQILNLMTAYLSIALRLSFTRGHPSFPNLRQVRRISTSGSNLLRHTGEIRRALALLERCPAQP